MPRLPPAPSYFPKPGEAIPFGRYENQLSSDVFGPWDKKNWLQRRFQRKAFIYAGVFSDELILGYAIADTGYIGLAFFYAFDRETNRFLEEKALRPFYFPSTFSPSAATPWEFRSGNRFWQVSPLVSGWRFQYVGKELEADFELSPTVAGITAIAPVSGRPFNTTFKLASIPARGRVRYGQVQKEIDAVGVVDRSLGYPARRAFWQWTSLCARTADGRRLGLNLVAHYNDGLENALWLEDGLFPLEEAAFQPGKRIDRDVWRITTTKGSIDMEFSPEGARCEKINLGVVSNDLVQCFGSFKGKAHCAGSTHPFVGSGVAEIHSARW